MLAHTVISAPDAKPTRAMWFLHGILGTRTNLRSFARRYVAARPDVAAVLVDLRRHGDSLSPHGPDDLEHCALDLTKLAQALPFPVQGVVGHSFGGKVALSWLARPDTVASEAWILDSLIGARPADAPRAHVDEVVDFLEATIKSFPDGFAKREAFAAQVVAAGFSPEIADWLAMNLRASGDGRRRFAVSIPAIRDLLASYSATDCWPIVEAAKAQTHLVIAGRGGTFTPDDRAHAFVLAERNPNVHVHLFEDAGHWVHIDALDALIAVMTA
jgi:esterase